MRVSVMDERVSAAYWNAIRALPVDTLERPRQFYQRWYDTYGFRVVGNELIFDREADLTYFILKWS